MVPRLKKEEKMRGEALIREALELLGEDAFKMAIIDLGRIQFTVALTFLHSQQWWAKNLIAAVELGHHAKTGLICRLIDKFIPNPGTIKQQEEARDTFVVQYTEVPSNAILPETLADPQ